MNRHYRWHYCTDYPDPCSAGKPQIPPPGFPLTVVPTDVLRRLLERETIPALAHRYEAELVARARCD